MWMFLILEPPWPTAGRKFTLCKLHRRKLAEKRADFRVTVLM
jgi:hypothetical protein